MAPRQVTAIRAVGKAFAKIAKGGLPAFITAITVLIECFGCVLFDSPVTPRGDALDITGYQLVFEDEFEGTDLDLEKWAYRGTGPRECGYVDPDAIEVKDGCVNLSAFYSENDAPIGWHAGMLRTNDFFTRGYFEMRAKCGGGYGFWDAFWINFDEIGSLESTNGGIDGAEIDILETWKEDVITSVVHVDGYGENHKSELVGKFKVDNVQDDYNTFGLLWTKDEYIFYFNGIETGHTSFLSGSSTIPEYVILSMCLPSSTDMPKNESRVFSVDYVRIYQLPEDITA